MPRRRLKPSTLNVSVNITSTLLLLVLVLAPDVVAAKPPGRRVISSTLEMRQPRPLKPNSSRGFHNVLHLHSWQPPLPAWKRLFHRLSLSAPPSSHKITTVSRTQLHSVPLYGGMVAVGEYYARVEIGRQTLRVQIDTGSATLAVPLKECTNCKRGDMRYSLEDSPTGIAKRIGCDDKVCEADTCSGFGCGRCSAKQACCAESNGTLCAFHLNFGDGSGAKGVLVQDKLKWDDVEFPVVFGGIRSDSDDFERSQVDGILGMAYRSLACNPSCITPTFDAMRDEYHMNDVFTICITYDSGKIVLGDFDSSLSTKEVTWVPLDLTSPPSFYSFPLNGNLKVNDQDVPLPSYTRAIVDSGTTLIVFSRATFTAFKKYLQENFCNVPGLCGEESWFRPAHCAQMSNEDRDKMPTLKFEVQGFVIELGPTDYLINYASKGPEYWCVGIMFLEAMSGGVDVILGNTVMKKYVTVYDRESSRVGFAESDTGCNIKSDDKANSGSTPSPVPSPSGVAGAVAGGGNNGFTAGSDDDDGETSGSGDSGQSNGGGSTGQQPKGNSNPRQHPQDASLCARAKNCTDCVKVKDASCSWDGADGKCIPGVGSNWTCTIEKLASNIVVIVGGAIGAIVVTLVVVALVVTSYRKRRNGSTEGGDSEAEQPLAPNDPDTRSAFSVGDEDEA